MKVRYIRESMSGNNENAFCHWVEIQAINYESTNIALNKKATCVGGNPEKGTLDMITNGNTSVDDYVYFRNVAEQTIFVTVDLGTVEDVDNIKVWHYYGNGRTYKNILLEVSLDGVKWTKIFDSNENGEYVEVEAGKTHKLKDDRLPLLNENSSLNEVTSFYEKYIKQDISNKEFLKNVLTSKEIECNDDKMLNLINKVGNIEIGKKWASGTVTSSTAKLTFSYYDGSSNTTWVYAQLPELNFNVSKIIYVMHDVNWIGVLDNVDKKNIIFAQYTDNSTTRGLICNFKLDNVVFSNNIYKLPVSNPSNQINVNWIAFE